MKAYCKPQRRTSQVKLLVTGLFLLAIASVIGERLNPDIRALFEIILFVSLVGAVQLTIRYLLTYYEYVITDAGELSVRCKQNGFRSHDGYQTLCTLNLSTALSLVPYEQNRDKIKGSRRYDFRVNLFGARTWIYECEFNGERVVLLLEPDNEFLDTLRLLTQKPKLDDVG